MAVLDFLTKKTRYSQALSELVHVEKIYCRPLQVADVGSGSEEFKKLLEARGHQVKGFDQHNCDLETGIPAKTGEFDLAICLAVAEHIDNWPLLLKELNRVADNTIMTTPSVFGKPVLDLLAALRLCDREHIKDHKHYLTRQDLEKAGYKTEYFLFGLNQKATSIVRPVGPLRDPLEHRIEYI